MSDILFVGLRRIPREGMESLLAARRLGHQVILIGRSVPDFARPLVHDFRQVDTFDTDRSVSVARELSKEYEVAGVANFTEADVQLVATIAADLGLPGMPVEAAVRARNKYVMKQGLAGLPEYLPRYRRVGSPAELQAAVEEIGLPAVVKPAGASGSKGIFELREPADLAPAFTRLAEITRPDFDPIFRQFPGDLIVEEYVDGEELSVEGFVAGGEVHVVTVTDKLTTVPFHLELDHRVPSGRPAAVLTEVTAMTRQVVTALAFDHVAFHLEAKVSTRGLRFIEVAARPAGDYIASHLVPMATGIDYFGNVIRAAVGDPLQLVPDRSLHAGLRFVLAPRAGRFDGIDGLPLIAEAPGYDHVFFEHPVGVEVALPPDSFGLQRVAAVCARHATREGLAALLAAVADGVTARITP